MQQPCTGGRHHCAAHRDAVAQVEAILSRVQEGLRTRDPQLLSSRDSYFYDDASPDHYVLFDVMPPDFDVGAQTLLEKNTRMLSLRSGPTVVYWTDKFVGADCSGAEGSYAYFRGILHSKIRYQDGRSFDATIRHTYVLKKVGGRYLIVHEHGSVPNVVMDIDPSTKPESK